MPSRESPAIIPSLPDFDRIIERSGTYATKWERYAGRDILPFWVADMDFAVPEFIRDAVARRLEHPILGYTRTPAPVVGAFQAWLARQYQWQVPEEWIVWIPGVVTGFNLAARATAAPDGSILIPTPVYYPFLDVPANTSQAGIPVPLVRDGRRWVMDFDALEAALRPGTRLVLLSNPQNPTGRAYTRAELEVLATFCVRHGLTICSDEIHSSLILDPSAQHVPIATLGQEIATASISLYAMTKTYNIPGLSCAMAVIPDPGLRRAFVRAEAGLVAGIGPLAYAATHAALEDRGPWLPALLEYLRGNHARLLEVAGPHMTPVEATYLAWLDVREFALEQPGEFFESQGLGLSDGRAFGAPGFVRFNFACPRGLLDQGLDRLSRALAVAAARA